MPAAKKKKKNKKKKVEEDATPVAADGIVVVQDEIDRKWTAKDLVGTYSCSFLLDYRSAAN